MKKRHNITNEAQAPVDHEIENIRAFTKHVVPDPAIPDDAHVEAIPISEREPRRKNDVVTPHAVAIVPPPTAYESYTTLKRPSKVKKSKATHWAEQSVTGNATHPVQQRSALKGQSHQKQGPKGR